jgi:aminoglycoside phosphotransferase (APT) family kinase protein
VGDPSLGLVLLDFGPGHCIFRPYGDVYVIDWEMGESGLVPEMQLAWMANWWGMDSVKYRSFRAGYFQDTTGQEDIALIRLFSTIFSVDSLRWAYQRKSTSLDDYIQSVEHHLNAFAALSLRDSR